MTEQVPDLRFEIADGLATITFDRPDSKVNLLTHPVMVRLESHLASVEVAAGRGEVRALLVQSAKPGNFIAGADIDQLAGLESAAAASEISRRGQAIFKRLERLSVPTLVAINGVCVGGGLELALACDYRVASDHAQTRFGFPETRLGFVPGLGGTVRTPRLIGLRAALDLILSGRQINSDRARELGLVDRILSAEAFDDEVAALAAGFARGKTPLRRHLRSTVARLLEDGPAARWIIKKLTRRAVLARTRGHYPALPAAVEVVVSSLSVAPEKAYEQEAEAFGRLAVTTESKNLIAVFQLTEGARKRVPDGEAATVRRAAVVGAGVMGAGIAELFAYQNVPVKIVDVDPERVEAGIERARELLEKAGERSGWSSEDLQARVDCLRGAVSYDGFDTVDAVVEAVVERLDVKKMVISALEDFLRPDAVIATNTSALSISKLQEELERPDRLCGLHFFNPPFRMPLVEVVRGAATSDDALATAFEIAVRLGKTPIIVKDSPGFVVNRVLAAYLTEAGYLLQEGMTVKELDRVMTRFGMPVGPARLLDEIGLDVVAEVSKTMISGFGERFQPAPIVGTVLATGVSGRKGGRGFYRYSDGKAEGTDSEIEAVLREASEGEPPGSGEAEERMVLAMINEAARTLDDRVVSSPENLDVAMIMGTGFPPFRGGLLRYADHLGLDHVADRLRHYASSVSARLEPATGLTERSSFYPS
jgi:3-hydroxyacyl-CoA dehydrogenase/enoyl-CoA hydratase/3-hydroxybutyryl-CoA epimerase